MRRCPPAGGDIAATAVTGAEPDGYTLLNATSSFTLNTAMGSRHRPRKRTIQ